MAWYPVKWGLTLEGEGVTKDQLRDELSRKEEEIRHLRKEQERLTRLVEELEQENEGLSSESQARWEDLERLKLRDKIAEELVRAIRGHFDRDGWNDHKPRAVYDLFTDWEQAGMSLNQ